MAKQTVLQMVQEILNDLDSDEVNSIDDTVESQQVANILRSTYTAMMSNRNWPHTRKPIQIVASGDSEKPTKMTLQDPIKEMSFINYNKTRDDSERLRYEPVKFLWPDDFLRVTNRRNNEEANVDIVQDDSGVVMLIYNDRAPQYYTTFDDENLWFDAYDSEFDDTLQTSKIQAMAYVMPVWTTADDFVPDLPDMAFSALIEEAKAKASFKLNQTQDLKAEQEAARQQRWLSRKARRVAQGVRYPNYGRRGGYVNLKFDKDNKSPEAET